MIAIIPAKTTSTRCPNKNWRPFAGSCLVNIAAMCAIRAGLRPKVVADSGLPVTQSVVGLLVFRPEGISDDTWAVVDWATKDTNEPIVLLQPTSPLRTPEFVRDCVTVHRLTGHNVTSIHDGKPSGSVYIRKHGSWSDMGLFVDDSNPCDIDTEEQFAEAERVKGRNAELHHA